MCGVLCWYDKKEVHIENFTRSLKLLNHRGPDNQSVYLRNNRGKTYHFDLSATDRAQTDCKINLAMGNTRLAILDLDQRSNQPMISKDGKYALIYNGEIYNYLELKEELRALGEDFYTTGDTEVLFKALIRWGIDSVQKMNGMWAFVFYDMQKQKLILSRDRFGKKPLYYFRDNERFICASEYKSIFSILNTRRQLNSEFLNAFVAYNFWPSFEDGRTLYNDIYSVPIGGALLYDLTDGSIESRINNNVEQYLDTDVPADSLSVDNLAFELESAVKLRLRSDVSIGIMLSGGLDSSIISILANKLARGNVTYYTGDTGSKEDHDLEYARMLCRDLGIEVKEISIPLDKAATEQLERMTAIYEIPVMTNGGSIGANLLYAAMYQDGHKVVLNGFGGDEIFGGYFYGYADKALNSLIYKYKLLEALSLSYNLIKYRQLSAGTVYRRIKGSMKLLLKNIIRGKFNSDTPVAEAEGLLKNSPSGGLDDLGLPDFQLFDIKRGKLQNFLLINDRNSMMHSVECRNPLLDYRLVKYIKLKESLKFKGPHNKYYLRRYGAQLMNPALAWRVDKQGFRWDYLAFAAKNAQGIIDKIKESPVAGKIFNVEGVLGNWIPNKDRNLDSLILRIYSIAMLDSVYSCDL